ncbi:MAG: hypothetical protein HOP30_18075 [Cyclobacteriaceae bacterium]|nr:hypothetical protein [Cyclobacteriaceae bacterium]
MKRKNVLLSVALLLPVLVFIFLKFFGKNKFDIPVFHQDRIELIGDCNLNYAVPYRVPVEVLTSLNCVLWDPSVIVFSDLVGESKSRLETEIQTKKLNLIVAKGLVSEEELRKLSCVFILPPETNAVLVDGEQRIRGYYKLNDRDETDRLLVELKILFNEY